MPAIALVGPDGAGKTTVTRMLERSTALRLKYLYMGINTSSSNVALPTSRFVDYLHSRAASAMKPGTATEHPREPRAHARRPRGVAWATARLLNRLAEQWFRQLVAWSYQMRGYTVLYDRHFTLDFGVPSPKTLRLDQRIHWWCLEHLYPRPDLVILLDAPGEVLFARKGESTIAELNRRRALLLQQGARLRAFVAVDATQPLEAVYAEVARHIVAFCNDPDDFRERARFAADSMSFASHAGSHTTRLAVSPSSGPADA